MIRMAKLFKWILYLCAGVNLITTLTPPFTLTNILAAGSMILCVICARAWDELVDDLAEVWAEKKVRRS
jgi:hypothetical protein